MLPFGLVSKETAAMPCEVGVTQGQRIPGKAWLDPVAQDIGSTRCDRLDQGVPRCSPPPCLGRPARHRMTHLNAWPVRQMRNADGAVPGALRSVPGDQKGFTLVELLTVIAIIAVLATLVMSALTSAKKAARQARCIANLHQLSLAVDMYLDDHEKRSPDLGHLTSSRYLSSTDTLICPSDKTRNWAGLVEGGPLISGIGQADSNAASGSSISGSSAGPELGDGSFPPQRSYLTPLWWDDEAWNRLMKAGGNAGIAVCQLHGLGRANFDSPSIRDFQGLVLRARRDGAVIKRQVFWESEPESSGLDQGEGAMNAMRSMAVSASLAYPWRLFLDDSDAEE